MRGLFAPGLVVGPEDHELVAAWWPMSPEGGFGGRCVVVDPLMENVYAEDAARNAARRAQDGKVAARQGLHYRCLEVARDVAK